MGDTTTLITIIDIVNAGGVVAILVILLAGFYTGKIISRKVHDEMNEKQTMLLDRTIEKVDDAFIKHDERFDKFAGEVSVLAKDYYEWQQVWKQTLETQTRILRSINNELKKANGEGEEKGSGTPVP